MFLLQTYGKCTAVGLLLHRLPATHPLYKMLYWVLICKHADNLLRFSVRIC